MTKEQEALKKIQGLLKHPTVYDAPSDNKARHKIGRPEGVFWLHELYEDTRLDLTVKEVLDLVRKWKSEGLCDFRDSGNGVQITELFRSR